MVRVFSLLTGILVLAGICGSATAAGTDSQTGKVSGNAGARNGLADAVSPYLRSYADAPVNWHMWSLDTLKKAARENKPIFVTIGYSSCYWCHYMAREVFAAPEIADLLNGNFIPVMVDRETRPDVDKIYMIATVETYGQGAWPNNLILTPDLLPFFARGVMHKPQMDHVLNNAIRMWTQERPDLEDRSAQFLKAMQSAVKVPPKVDAGIKSRALVLKYYKSLQTSFDAGNGGFGTGSKFPWAHDLMFLLDFYEQTGRREALDMARQSVDAMLAGGIHDQVGGGFHRYTTDPAWHIPHFEKTLYTQGFMAAVLARLYARTGEDRYKRAITRLTGFLKAEMQIDAPLFANALSAETGDVDGAYYAWTAGKLRGVLGEKDYEFFMSYFELADLPQFSGKKTPEGGVLYLKNRPSDQEKRNRLDLLLGNVKKARNDRQRPDTDRKILAGWNGIVILGLAEAAKAGLGEEALDMAEAAANKIWADMYDPDTGLARVIVDGKPQLTGYLEDYAWLARAYAALYRTTGNQNYLERAITLAGEAEHRFHDTLDGGFYFAPKSALLPVHMKQSADSGNLPAGNAAMAHLYADLYDITGDQAWQDKKDRLVRRFGKLLYTKTDTHGHFIHTLVRGSSLQDWDDEEEAVAVTREKADGTPSPQGSAAKVSATARLVSSGTSGKPVIRIEIKPDQGWYINANPASMDFLIPTTVDLSMTGGGRARIQYPLSLTKNTPLGEMEIYEGDVTVKAFPDDATGFDQDEARILLEFQACRAEICLPPSEMTLPVQ